MFSIFGINDPQIWIGYGLCILLTLICIVYGLLNWNREGGADGS
ncbi:MAG TPA: hypothetical protein VN372_01330 [Methanospirillum sp.]|nr:hypothetical protein [Methanospirillum sp.]